MRVPDQTGALELLSGIFLPAGLDRFLLVCPAGFFRSSFVRQEAALPLGHIAFAVPAISAFFTDRTNCAGLMISVDEGRPELARRDLKRRF